MAYTTHGHHIPDTAKDPDEKPLKVTLCGGTHKCESCRTEMNAAWKSRNPTVRQDKARRYVKEFIEDRLPAVSQLYIPPYDIHIVSYTEAFQNWKCLLRSSLNGQTYYEVVYDGMTNLTHITSYNQSESTVING